MNLSNVSSQRKAEGWWTNITGLFVGIGWFVAASLVLHDFTHGAYEGRGFGVVPNAVIFAVASLLGGIGSYQLRQRCNRYERLLRDNGIDPTTAG